MRGCTARGGYDYSTLGSGIAPYLSKKTTVINVLGNPSGTGFPVSSYLDLVGSVIVRQHARHSLPATSIRHTTFSFYRYCSAIGMIPNDENG